MLNAILLCR